MIQLCRFEEYGVKRMNDILERSWKRNALMLGYHQSFEASEELSLQMQICGTRCVTVKI